MNPLEASRTALTTALMRARHTRLDANPLIDDPWGDVLVPPQVREAIGARLTVDPQVPADMDKLIDDWMGAHTAYPNVIIRSRYTEDCLRAAIDHGTSQYVLLGAGFDSFSLRRPAYADAIDIFEVDHPATQTLKRQRIAESGIILSPHVHMVAIDFVQEDLKTALARSLYRHDARTFFSWLGVTNYLTHKANMATFKAVALCAAPGSEIAFTYVDSRIYDPQYQTDAFRDLQTEVAAIGEPFQSGFDPVRLDDELRTVGLTIVEDLNGKDIVARYGRVGTKNAEPATFSHIARARVL